MSKITLVGCGMIGQTLAQLAILKNLATDLVLVDIAKEKAEGAMMDIVQSCPMEQKDISCIATDDYAKIEGSDVIVVTAGVTGVKPNQDPKDWNRDQMLETNVKIISSIGKNVAKYAPNAFVIIITNPLDSMVRVFQKASGLPTQMVVGEAGTDDSRIRHFSAEALGVSVQDVTGFVVGEHGDGMVPLLSTVTAAGIPAHFSDKEKADIREKVTMAAKRVIDKCGVSPYRTVASAAMNTVEAFLRDRSRILGVSNYDRDQDLYYAWPCIINGKGVVRRALELDDITAEERKQLEVGLEKIKMANTKADALLSDHKA